LQHFFVDALPTQMSKIASRKRHQIHADLAALMTAGKGIYMVKDLGKIFERS
jgi:hypothetical protein